MVKTIECLKCHKTSNTIATEHVCDKCGAEYVFDKVRIYGEGLYLKDKKHALLNKLGDSTFLGELIVLTVTLVLAILVFFEFDDLELKLFALIPLAISMYMFYRIFRRVTKARFDLYKIVGIPEEKLSKKAIKIKEKSEVDRHS